MSNVQQNQQTYIDPTKAWIKNLGPGSARQYNYRKKKHTEWLKSPLKVDCSTGPAVPYYADVLLPATKIDLSNLMVSVDTKKSPVKDIKIQSNVRKTEVWSSSMFATDERSQQQTVIFKTSTKTTLGTTDTTLYESCREDISAADRSEYSMISGIQPLEMTPAEITVDDPKTSTAFTFPEFSPNISDDGETTVIEHNSTEPTCVRIEKVAVDLKNMRVINSKLIQKMFLCV